MKHIKTYHSVEKETENGSVIIEGPLTAEQLQKYEFHEDLTAFRIAKQQFNAIISISKLPEGRIIIARTENEIIGYVTYLYPDPLERWSEIQINNLIVLGAIEVIPAFRGEKIASHLLEVSMMDPFVENYIIISTEYYWHWDLDRTKLSMWDYRKVMEKMMAAGGLIPARTDDPEITSHPANCLMVRIGNNVDQQTIEQFDKLRFLRRHQFNQTKGRL